MNILKKLGLIVSSLVFIGSTVLAEPEVGQAAPAFSGIDSNGNEVSLSQFLGKPVVLEWTNHLCPYVRKHYESGNMQRLQRELTEDGAIWISIISSAPGKPGYVNGAEANELTALRGVYANAIILDPKGTIGRVYEAKTTPQMFLIDENGVLLYQGAIDDQPSSRRSTLDGATNYLAEAWASYKSGDPVAVPSSKPYGCTVKYSSIEGYK